MAKVDAGLSNTRYDTAASTAGTSAAGAGQMFAMLKAWQAAGWKCMEASDGTTYVSYRGSGGTTGAVVITHVGSGGGGMHNARSWYVVQEPGGVREHLIMRGATSGRVGIWVYSRSAKFTGGTPNATTRSTASDEAVLINDTNFFTTDTTANAKRFHGCAFTAPKNGVYPFYFWQSVDGDTTTYGHVMCEPLAEYPSGDNDPCLLHWADNATGVSTNAISNYTLTRGFYGWYKPGLGGTAWVKYPMLTQHNANVDSEWVPDDLGPNPITGKHEGSRGLFSLEDISATPGRKGRSVYIRWKGTGAHVWPDTLTTPDGERWVYSGNILIPYMNGVTPNGGALVSTDRAGEFYDADPVPVVPDTAPPTVTFDPASGAELEATDPVTVTIVDDDVVAQHMLTVYFPSTGSWEVVHDGSVFAPSYSIASTRAAVAGGYAYEVSRVGGWPASPTFRVYAIDAEGNVA